MNAHHFIVSFQRAPVADQQTDCHQFSVCKTHPFHVERHRARLQSPNSISNKKLIEDQMIAKISFLDIVTYIASESH